MSDQQKDPRQAQALMENFGTTRPPDATRERFRQQALRSTIYFGMAVVGFKDLTTDFHKEMARFIQSPSRRKLGLAPRGHLKTSLWTIADTLRRVSADPNQRILIINETVENAAHFLAKIRTTVERNQIYRWLFPEVLPGKGARWHKLELEFKRTVDYPEATIEVIGVGGASTSRHYDLIKEDDLIGKSASESKVEMSRAIDQHKLAESLLDSPDKEIQCYGTRWSPYDLTRWMLENEPALHYFKLGIFTKEGQPIWPERFTAEHIANLKRKYGPGMFALQYLNEALAEGVTELSADWLRHWRWGTGRNPGGEEVPIIIMERPITEGGRQAWTLESLETFQILDPCHSPTSGDARSAVVTVGLTPTEPFNIIVLDATAKKCSPKETIDMTYALYRKFNPVSCGIEVVGAQKAFFYWIPTRHPDMAIRPLKTSTHKSKESRIRGFAPYAEQGRLYVHRNQFALLEEWEAFPQGRTVDLLDALAYMPQIWAPPEQWDAPAEEDDETYVPQMDGRSPLTGY